MTDHRTPSRRAVLAALASAGGVALAGCSGSTDDTPAGAATDDRTPTSSPTPTPEDAGPDPSLPATGDVPPELAGVDAAVREFAAANDVTAAAFGLSVDGEVVLERGYGWADADRTVETPPDAPFRIASITKALTAAAVRSLLGEGLERDTTVLSVLDIEPPSGSLADERFADVTVEHLLTHSGGWNAQAAGFDPVFHSFAIADELGLSESPDTRQIARYMLDQPLQFDPGSQHVYANFGYALLGLVVEAVSGTPFPQYLRETLFADGPPGPLYEGASLPAERREREVYYDSTAQCPNAVGLAPQEQVPCADGGFYLQGLGGAGELVTTTRTLLAFLEAHPVDGFATPQDYPNEPIFGSLPGTFTMAHDRGDGVRVAVLLNRRGRGFLDLAEVVDGAIDKVESWP